MGAHVESAEAGVGHEASQLVGFVEREDDLHERGDVGGEVRRQGVLEDGEDLGCGPWDEHQRSARRREDPAHLAQRPQAVGEELQPELAQHEVEGSVGERERIGGRLVPGDRHTAGRRGPSDRQHPGVEVDACDRALGPDTLGSHAGHDSRPAGDVQYPLTGPDPATSTRRPREHNETTRTALRLAAERLVAEGGPGAFSGRRSVQQAAVEFNAMLEGLANAELRGGVLPNLPAGSEEQAWRHALTTVIAGFSAS